MDRRERSGSNDAAMLAFGEGWQSKLWTALPGIIQSFDPATKTCVVQPTIRALVTLPDYSTQWMDIPQITDCPVVFPGGGGVTLTFPLQSGDECLLVFASRCIDAWWQSGGVQLQAELRMHDLSDGFCIPGVSSVPAVPANISAVYAEMRTVDGTAYMRLNPSTKQIDHVTTGVLNLKGGTVNITATSGALTMQGQTATNVSSVANNTKIDGKTFLPHTHGGVVAGGATTGGVS